MKNLAKLALLLGFLFCSSAAAQTDLTGTWQGKVSARPNESYQVQFVITRQENGSYKALFISPKNINHANEVKIAGNTLTINVYSLRSSYSGTVDKDTITGEWRQQNSIYPLALSLQKPDMGALKPLFGEWVGTLWLDGAIKRIGVFRFGTAGNGRFAAYMDLAGTPRIGELITDVSLAGDKVSWKAPDRGINFSGRLSGNRMIGVNTNGHFEMSLAKEKYQPGMVDMPSEDRLRLLGQWVGKWNIPGETTYTFVLRFEKTKDGKLEASFNIPLEGQSVFSPLADVSLKGDRLSFWIPKMWNGDNTDYAGKLTRDSISGIFTFREKQYAVNLTRDTKIEVPAARVEIPAKKMETLLGRWNGKAGQVPFALRFERNADGKLSIFAEDPVKASGANKGMMAVKVTMTDNSLWVQFPFRGAELSGKLNFLGNRIDGTVKVTEGNSPQYLSSPFSLTKELF